MKVRLRISIDTCFLRGRGFANLRHRLFLARDQAPQRPLKPQAVSLHRMASRTYKASGGPTLAEIPMTLRDSSLVPTSCCKERDATACDPPDC
jgi:hypothetical protein